MIKFYLRENMKLIKQFLLLSLFFVPCISGAQVATTAGSNLTAWNGNSGATNNNNWNTLMNNRTLTGGAGAPTADFGNCNSLIMRCAQPKCAACTTLEIAKPIVEGCVNSNKDCKKHGNDLVDFIAAQIVANANAKIQEQQLMAQQAAAQAAAAQSNQQMQQMQMQMQQMQQQMQAQNAQQMASMQAALEEQKALVAQAQQEAAAAQQAKIDAQTAPGVTVAQQVAIDSGVSEDVLVRQQISGQILSAVENAEVQLKTLKATMQNAFEYAGCDARGNNCTGPKRVKMFKEKAMKFFEPYDAIADEMYEALEMALAVGVDVSDVIMMLSGSCNKWGKYMCTGDKDGKHDVETYTNANCVGGKSVKNGDFTRGGFECRPQQAIPPQDDVRCTLIGLITGDGEDDTVERNGLDEYDGDKLIRVGCATSALDSISIFGRRKSNNKNRAVDLDTLERIILQDAPEYSAKNRFSNAGDSEFEKLKYCALTPRGYERLRNAVTQRKLPSDKICVPYDSLYRTVATNGVIGYGDVTHTATCGNYVPELSGDDDTKNRKYCNNMNVEYGKEVVYWDAGKCKVKDDYSYYSNKVISAAECECRTTRGTWAGDRCTCPDGFKLTGQKCQKKNLIVNGGKLPEVDVVAEYADGMDFGDDYMSAFH